MPLPTRQRVAVTMPALAAEGATFVVGVGKEPLCRPDDPTSPSIAFDWTALEAIHDCVVRGATPASGTQGRLLAAVATEKTDDQIPAARLPVWNGLRAADGVRLEFVEAGWTSGAVRRTRQAQLGDVLIALSGGEGVEHLAQLYAAEGKPIIPLDLKMGASMDDGSGGAGRLAPLARAHPERFVRLVRKWRDQAAAGAGVRVTS
jgi:TIR- and PNP-associating SLOG family